MLRHAVRPAGQKGSASCGGEEAHAALLERAAAVVRWSNAETGMGSARDQA